jgi:hypothetical protein
VDEAGVGEAWLMGRGLWTLGGVETMGLGEEDRPSPPPLPCSLDLWTVKK